VDFERDEEEENQSARTFVAALQRIRIGLFDERAGAVEVVDAHQAAGKRPPRGLVQLEPAPQTLLDPDASLEESGGDLERPGLRHRHPRDRSGDQDGISYSLGPHEPGPGISEGTPNVGLQHADPAEVGQDRCGASIVVGRFAQRVLTQLDNRRKADASNARQGEQHVGTVSPGHCLRQDLLQDRCGAVPVARQAMMLSRPQLPPPPRRIVGRKRAGDGQLEQLGGRGGGATARGMIGRGVEGRGHRGISARRRECQVARAFLGILHHRGESSVHFTPSGIPGRLVADGGKERVREASRV